MGNIIALSNTILYDLPESKYMIKGRTQGFTISELVGLFLLISFFVFGFYIGDKIVPHWQGPWGILLIIVSKIFFGFLSALIFIFFCMGIGFFLEKRKDRGDNQT